MTKEEIHRRADELAPWVSEVRKHIHRNPELSFQEKETSGYVASILEEMGIPFERVADTGLLARLEGKNPESRLICLRSELDALPIKEANETDYVSRNEGVMHACGHDVHTSCLLGALRILKELQGEWEGTVWALVQPGEEKLPGGASLVLKEKAFQERKPNLFLAQHVMPELEAGKVGFRPGMYMASADELYITVKGKGGHGAMPHLAIDPILIASHLIVALQQTVSRWSHPAVPTVLSFGKIQGNGVTNVIPSEVKIEGTFRTYDEAWRSQAHSRMKALVKGMAESMGGEAELEVMVGYPSLHNSPKITLQLQEDARTYLGAEYVDDLDLRPTADDFAFYTQVAPSCFYRLGVGNKEKGITYSVHHPKFDIDEAALPVGVGLLAWLAFQCLINKS